jgi:protein TonB
MGNSIYIGIAAIIVLLFALSVFPGFLANIFVPSSWVRRINKSNPDKDSVFLKKYPQADIKLLRTIFFLVGFILTFGLLIVAFNVKEPAREEVESSTMFELETEEVDVTVATTHAKPIPPPPPPAVASSIQVIEVSDDRVVGDLEFQDVDSDDDIILGDVFEVGGTGTEPIFSSDYPGDTEEEDVPDLELFVVVEDMPVFENELPAHIWVQHNVKYPIVAMENGIEGKVYVEFVIEKDGKVTNPVIIRDIGGGCGDEVLKALEKMPNWVPGKQRGKPVRVRMTIPVKFHIP